MAAFAGPLDRAFSAVGLAEKVYLSKAGDSEIAAAATEIDSARKQLSLELARLLKGISAPGAELVGLLNDLDHTEEEIGEIFSQAGYSNAERDEAIKSYGTGLGDAKFAPHYSLTQNLLRGLALGGNVGPALLALNIYVARITLVWSELQVSHAFFVSKDLPSVEMERAEQALQRAHDEIQNVSSLFDGLPDFSFGRATVNGGLNVRLFADFLRFFGRAKSLLVPADIKYEYELPRAAVGSVAQMVGALGNIENYLSKYYRPSWNDGYLANLGRKLFDRPEFAECVQLTSDGYTSHEGVPCHPKPFLEALKSYIEFHDWNVGTDLVSRFSFDIFRFSKEKEREGGNWVADAPKELRASMQQYIARANFPDGVRSGTQKVIEDLFSDSARLEKMGGDEFFREDTFKALFSKYGVKTGLGFKTSHEDNAMLAKAALSAAENIQQFSQFDKPLERLSWDSSCKEFVEHDVEHSPLIAVSLRDADSSLRSAAGNTAAGRRLHDRIAKVANAVNLSMVAESADPSHVLLAGLGQQVGLELMIPTIVGTRLLLDLPVGDSLESLGLRGDGGPTLAHVRSRYGFKSWAELITAEKAAYAEAARALIKERDGEKAATAEGVELSSSEARRYRELYAKEMAKAAEDIRQLGSFRSGWHLNIADRMPPLWNAMGYTTEQLAPFLDGPKTGNPEADTDRLRRSMNLDFTRMYDDLLFKHLRAKHPEATIEQVRELMLETEMDLETYVDAFRRYGWDWTNSLWHQQLRENPYLLARILNHINLYPRARNAAAYAQTLKLLHFPSLKMNRRSLGSGGLRQPWYMSYRDTMFGANLQAYLENAVDRANELLTPRSASALNKLIRNNIPLSNAVVSQFGDMKLQLCLEQAKEAQDRAWRDSLMNTLMIGQGAGWAASMMPPTGMLGAVSRIGNATMTTTAFIAIAASGIETYEKWAAIGRAHSYEIATAAQRSLSDLREDPHFIRRLDLSFADDIARMTMWIGWSKLTTGKMQIADFRSLVFRRHIAPAVRNPIVGNMASSRRWLRKVPRWARNGFRSFQHAHNAAGRFMERTTGTFARFSTGHKTFWQRFAGETKHPVLRAVGNTTVHGFHFFFNQPASWFGYRWGDGVVPKALMAAMFYHLGSHVLHKVNDLREIQVSQTLDRIGRTPDANLPILQKLSTGEWTPERAVRQLAVEDQVRNIVLDVKVKVTTEYFNLTSPELQAAFVEDTRGVLTQVREKISELESQPNFDPVLDDELIAAAAELEDLIRLMEAKPQGVK